jgi:hypothetical protein
MRGAKLFGLTVAGSVAVFLALSISKSLASLLICGAYSVLIVLVSLRWSRDHHRRRRRREPRGFEVVMGEKSN